MKIFKLTILVLSLIFAISSCKKEEEKIETPVEKDLTTTIVGSYSGTMTVTINDNDTIYDATITVTKISNNSVKITYNNTELPQVYNLITNVTEVSPDFGLTIPKADITGTYAGYYEGVSMSNEPTEHGAFISSSKLLVFNFKHVINGVGTIDYIFTNGI